MPHLRWGLGLLLAIACAPSPAPLGKVVIRNLQSGTVCGPPSAPRICQITSTIDVTGQGSCVFNRTTIPCTWFGYSFDYDLPSSTATLQCEWQSDVGRRMGNPDQALAENASHGQYELTLRNDTHHYINPQYRGLSAADSGGSVESLRQSCGYAGEQLFEVAFEFRYPMRP